MNLYRFAVTLNTGKATVIVAAENEEKAFNQVDIELERHYLKLPIVEEVILYEKRPIKNSVGFVISDQEDGTAQ